MRIDFKKIRNFLLEDDHCAYIVLALCILFLVLVSVCTSCCPCRNISNTQKDSVRIETHFIATEKIDTQYIKLPVEVYRNVTKDTFSFVSTTFASSTAKISDGILYHEISNRNTSLPVQYVTRTEYKDTIMYRDRNVEKVVEVKSQPTRFQLFQQYGFWVLLVSSLALSFAFLYSKFRK